MPVTTTLDGAAAVEGPAGSRRSAREAALSGVRVALDFISDWAVVSFASWTLLAYVGMITEARVSLLVPIWLATMPLLAALLVILRMRSSQSPEAAATPERTEEAFPHKVLLAVGLVAGLLAASLAAWASDLPWAIVWLPAFVAAAAVVGAGKLRSRARAFVVERTTWPADLLAAAVGVAFAAMSLLIARANADDAFYVNRATATGQLNHIPVNDVIFTHEEVARAGGAGLPVDSYQALEGAVGRLVGLHPATVAYLVFPPVFTFLATWALWRLVRAWAPRHAWLCFVLGSLFWIWSAQHPLTSGNYFLNRIWQGKVAFVAWLVPTLYVYLTRWLGQRDALTALLLLVAGLSSIGMTGSATFVVPLVFLAAVIPLAVRMEWSALAVPLAAAAIPFGIGIFVLTRFPLSEAIGSEPLPAQSWFYHQVVGEGLVAAVAALGVWAAPWLARAGPAERLTSGLAVVFALLIVPGIVALLSDVAGLTETLRRTLWIVPFPALVGLLAAVSVTGRIGRLVPAAVAVSVAALLVAFGTPLWRHLYEDRSLWHYPPGWKAHRIPEARVILRKYQGDGPILAERGVMLAIALVTAEPKAVNARTLYLERTRLPAEQIEDRILLTNFISRENPLPSAAQVRRALTDIHVGLVCARDDGTGAVPAIRRLGTLQEVFRAHGELCFQPRTASSE